jgi:hypothetical protein
MRDRLRPPPRYPGWVIKQMRLYINDWCGTHHRKVVRGSKPKLIYLLADNWLSSVTTLMQRHTTPK